MTEATEEFGRIRLGRVMKALEANNFRAFVAENADEAGRIVLEQVVPNLEGGIVSWGGSLTLGACHVKRFFHESSDWDVLSVEEKGLSPEEKLDRRRKALLSDLYFLGTNAVTEDGVLVNLDMIGNRVGALTFGPKNVVVLLGRNKIEPDLFAAMERVRSYASPANAIRLDMKTPCVKTASCHDCSSKDRICNNWTLTEKSFPRERITVILINEDLGL